jgi:hypothetical protein
LRFRGALPFRAGFRRVTAGLVVAATSGLVVAATSGLVVAATPTATADVKFTSTWAAPDAGSISFKGQRVAALVISDDQSLRVSAEEALSRELTARGMTGRAAYRMIPAEELKNVERAKGWFERGKVTGVVALRPVSEEKVKRYTPDLWTSPYYSSFWGYYPYGWGATYTVGSVSVDTVIVVETLVYQVSTGKLIWAGVSESTNPKTLQTLIAEIVKEAAKKIERQFKE